MRELGLARYCLDHSDVAIGEVAGLGSWPRKGQSHRRYFLRAVTVMLIGWCLGRHGDNVSHLIALISASRIAPSYGRSAGVA